MGPATQTIRTVIVAAHLDFTDLNAKWINLQNKLESLFKQKIKIMKNLSGVKAEKFGIFYSFFGESTETFVMSCNGRGENAWSKVLDKVHALDTLQDANIKSMADDLYSKFTLQETFPLPVIIKLVSQSARDHGVKPSQNSKWYLDWFSSLFLVEKVKNGATTVALKPLFKLMPNQN